MLSLTDLHRAHPLAWPALAGPDGAAPSWTGPLWSRSLRCFVHVHEEIVGDAYRCSRLDGTGTPTCNRDDLLIDFAVDGVFTRFATACARALGARPSDGAYWLHYSNEAHPVFELEGTSPWAPSWSWEYVSWCWSMSCSSSELDPPFLPLYDATSKPRPASEAHAFLSALVLSLADRIG